MVLPRKLWWSREDSLDVVIPVAPVHSVRRLTFAPPSIAIAPTNRKWPYTAIQTHRYDPPDGNRGVSICIVTWRQRRSPSENVLATSTTMSPNDVAVTTDLSFPCSTKAASYLWNPKLDDDDGIESACTMAPPLWTAMHARSHVTALDYGYYFRIPKDFYYVYLSPVLCTQ